MPLIHDTVLILLHKGDFLIGSFLTGGLKQIEVVNRSSDLFVLPIKGKNLLYSTSTYLMLNVKVWLVENQICLSIIIVYQ
jgi:hypothetical protein